ncbi:calmodulin-binding transcription activator 6-like isoform X2 [Glycine soja]|uniref:Calmodulin-binding transcription activator 5 isoform B n=1 Tax=Glycine soja TaxID=3848 RepID=A0A445K0Z2_GLYSO|nr:calmodulin-binding transcription activator 6-like isoform X2 [Glycine soja]RZC04434.1 Calmodulin-binding transcription activator 5 isoform B [Glycine soja]
MANNLAVQLVGSEMHGFHTLQDLDVGSIMEEARTRWLRPNEIHAMLCGTIVLFDRKMLRNFRKDGHNWKKKKDGKTVKEAHEHLKVGNEERIHVYYAHGQDNPNFVRRCYWLLDKSMEHIVLVHYRETQEMQGSPVTPVNSHSSSVSDPPAPWILSEEIDSGTTTAYTGDMSNNINVKSHELRLHEINTLEWDDLVDTNDHNASTVPNGGTVPYFDQQDQILLNDSFGNVANNLSAEIPSFGNLTQPIAGSNRVPYNFSESVTLQTMDNQANPHEQKNNTVSLSGVDSLDTLVNDRLQSQDSFGMWVNHIMSDSPCSVDDPALESPVSSIYEPYSSLVVDSQESSLPEQVFTITDVSPTCVSSTEKSKVLVTGFFLKDYMHLSKSNLLCVCGDVSVPAEIVQVGVYRCWVSPHSPGFVNLYLSIDGHKPISQVVNFEYRTPALHDPAVSMEESDNWDEFRQQMRLAYLLFAKQLNLDVISSKVSPNRLKEARQFALKTSFISNSWQYLIKSTEDNQIPFSQAKDALFGITLKNRLKEWLLERIVLGCKTTEYDAHGQSVIHLCAILGYNWAVSLFSWSGLSLDFRDRFGWTALHWAAYCGREKMVATLLSAGAKPNLVTDPTPQNPGGCTAADLAYMRGHDGLAAYLSEKSLVQHFNDMSLAGNISGSLETSTTDPVNPANLTEDQQNLKDTLTAYRTAAEAASRIHAAFREHSLKLRTKAVASSNPEAQARKIVAAMKIQHAFRNHETKKMMAAAARIQCTYRTWKIRKEFLNMRRQAVKIQAAFRCFQVRKHYRKILWSVGVVEKAVLRWRLKRRGFRGLQVKTVDAGTGDQDQQSDVEEEFFRTGRKQAEERVERSVVRVQAMFRSKKAQEEYRRMKLALNQAKLEREYEQLLSTEVDMQL